MIVRAEAPEEADVRPTDLLFVCHHEPRHNWVKVTGLGFECSTTDGTVYQADWLAVCDACNAIPLTKLDLILAIRCKEEKAHA